MIILTCGHSRPVINSKTLAFSSRSALSPPAFCHRSPTLRRSILRKKGIWVLILHKPPLHGDGQSPQKMFAADHRFLANCVWTTIRAFNLPDHMAPNPGVYRTSIDSWLMTCWVKVAMLKLFALVFLQPFHLPALRLRLLLLLLHPMPFFWVLKEMCFVLASVPEHGAETCRSLWKFRKQKAIFHYHYSNSPTPGKA